MRYALTESDSWAFARLSGDFNPLHVDAVAARRLQFGGTVCHGVHLVLKALDLATAAGLLVPAEVAAIGAVFGAPVRTGTPVELLFNCAADAQNVRLLARAEGRSLFTAKLALAVPLAALSWPAEAPPEEPQLPFCLAFPASDKLPSLASSVPLRLNAALMRTLFPALADQAPGCRLAVDLLATTRIVGMACPGLHSIYSEFKLQRRAPDAVGSVAAMHYTVLRSDPRFRSIRVAVTGGVLEGTLEAFFRAPPVAQPLLAELRPQIDARRFAGQHALVVGGSRGLGELAAKILLAGGAKVALTYARGLADAERIGQEATALGLDCRLLHLDASQPLPEALAAELAAAEFTHLYYFATPQITKNATGTWNPGLFDEFCRIYVCGLAELVRAAAPRGAASTTLQLLYPSTVFLDRPAKGFAEYCAAKAAGEVVCEHLALAYGVVAYKPRLDRLKTDQNSSFLGVEGAAPLPVILDLLDTLQADPTPLPEQTRV